MAARALGPWCVFSAMGCCVQHVLVLTFEFALSPGQTKWHKHHIRVFGPSVAKLAVEMKQRVGSNIEALPPCVLCVAGPAKRSSSLRLCPSFFANQLWSVV